ncbi:MAG TPA: molybdate ABC transporter substrate-binding protein [Nocardioidaceae bacterium]|nr:molybdate ABC transporter substrate-binding protein [Nocardioidaceae bacterium]
MSRQPTRGAEPVRGARGRRHGTAVATLVLTVAAGLAGCGSGSTRSTGESDRRLLVLAAASLTDTFTTLADDFEADHPGVTVKLAFDSSATLAEQVNQGAPADVLATADEATMRTVADEGGVEGAPRIFATNQLQLVVPTSNPAGIEKLGDIARPGVEFVVCVDTAPCGKLAGIVLDEAGITAPAASEEVDVKAVLSKVSLDEADAGLVYATDAVAADDDVTVVSVPGSQQNRTTYPVAALSGAEQPALAGEFVDLVLSPQGRRVLSDAGFGQP